MAVEAYTYENFALRKSIAALNRGRWPSVWCVSRSSQFALSDPGSVYIVSRCRSRHPELATCEVSYYPQDWIGKADTGLSAMQTLLHILRR